MVAIVNKAFFHKMYTDGTLFMICKNIFLLSKLYVKCLLVMHHIID